MDPAEWVLAGAGATARGSVGVPKAWVQTVEAPAEGRAGARAGLEARAVLVAEDCTALHHPRRGSPVHRSVR